MESLENNLFFNALTTTYRKRYQEVIKNCYHLCIPVNNSYEVRQINDKFITSHILKPSPLLKSHFLPYNNKQNFHVQIESNYIKVTKGFGDQNVKLIEILSEQKAYNSSNNAYNIFICASPLISSLNCKLNYEHLNSTSQDIELVSFEDCEKFLHNISNVEQEKLKRQITQLIKTYIILPDYIEDVALRLKKIIDISILLFSSYYSKNVKYKDNKELLKSTIESYSVGLIYKKLISLINKKLAKEDDLFVQNAKEIKKLNLKPTDFGAQKAFENFTVPTDLIRTFSELNSQITPLSKLNCMRKTLDIINDQLKKTVDDHKSPLDKNPDTVYIMSDDLIAAVICTIAQCEPAYFCSNIKFIHFFSWYLPQNSELGYSLVTFEVAKEYIQNHCSQVYGNSISPNKYHTQLPPFSAANCSNINSFSEFSKIDQEIDKITKIIKNSSQELNSPSTFCSHQNTEELGGFLGSLAGDFLTMSGQKY